MDIKFSASETVFELMIQAAIEHNPPLNTSEWIATAIREKLTRDGYSPDDLEEDDNGSG